MHVRDYRFYYRRNYMVGNSVVKIEIGDGRHWFEAEELWRAYEFGDPVDIGAMLRVGIRTLESYGMADLNRLLSRKQVYLRDCVPALDAMVKLGWEVIPYPRKFIPPVDADGCRDDVKTSGISLDASNLIKSDHVVNTHGLAFKAAVDLLSGNGVPFNVYADWNLWGGLRSIGGQELYDYLMGFTRVGTFGRVFTARPEDPHCRGKADPLMLLWAKRTGMHILSRDEFDEFDLEYDFVMHGAEWGRQRLHKFRCENGVFSIPDLGLEIEVPTSF